MLDILNFIININFIVGVALGGASVYILNKLGVIK